MCQFAFKVLELLQPLLQLRFTRRNPILPRRARVVEFDLLTLKRSELFDQRRQLSDLRRLIAVSDAKTIQFALEVAKALCTGRKLSFPFLDAVVPGGSLLNEIGLLASQRSDLVGECRQLSRRHGRLIRRSLQNGQCVFDRFEMRREGRRPAIRWHRRGPAKRCAAVPTSLVRSEAMRLRR